MIQSLDLGANENKLLLGLAEKARKAATRRRKRAASRKGSRQDSIPNTTSTYWRSASFQCETVGIDVLTARAHFIGMAVIVFMLFLGGKYTNLKRKLS